MSIDSDSSNYSIFSDDTVEFNMESFKNDLEGESFDDDQIMKDDTVEEDLIIKTLPQDCFEGIFKFLNSLEMTKFIYLSNKTNLSLLSLAQFIFRTKFKTIDFKDTSMTNITLILKDFGMWLQSIDIDGYVCCREDNGKPCKIINLISKYCNTNIEYPLKKLKLQTFITNDCKITKLYPIMLNLRVLDLTMVCMPDYALNIINKCPMLEEFSLKHCITVYPKPIYKKIKNHQEHPNLRKIYLLYTVGLNSHEIIQNIDEIAPNLEEFTYIENFTDKRKYVQWEQNRIVELNKLKILRIDFEGGTPGPLINSLRNRGIELKELIIHNARMHPANYVLLGRLTSLETIGYSKVELPKSYEQEFYQNAINLKEVHFMNMNCKTRRILEVAAYGNNISEIKLERCKQFYLKGLDFKVLEHFLISHQIRRKHVGSPPIRMQITLFNMIEKDGEIARMKNPNVLIQRK